MRIYTEAERQIIRDNYLLMDDKSLVLELKKQGFERTINSITFERISKMRLLKTLEYKLALNKKQREKIVYTDLSKIKRGQSLKKAWEQSKYKDAMGLKNDCKLTKPKINPKRLFTEAQIFEILTSKKTIIELAKIYKCSYCLIYNIKKGLNYKLEFAKFQSAKYKHTSHNIFNFR
jgi:hypothetical protein